MGWRPKQRRTGAPRTPHPYAGGLLVDLICGRWTPPDAEALVDREKMLKDETVPPEGAVIILSGNRHALCPCCRKRKREEHGIRLEVCTPCYNKAKLDRRFWKDPYQWVIDQRKAGQ